MQQQRTGMTIVTAHATPSAPNSAMPAATCPGCTNRVHSMQMAYAAMPAAQTHLGVTRFDSGVTMKETAKLTQAFASRAYAPKETPCAQTRMRVQAYGTGTKTAL